MTTHRTDPTMTVTRVDVPDPMARWYLPDEQQCQQDGFEAHTGPWTCTRRWNHTGRHHESYNGRILAVWGDR